jgi:hypothetical protein
MTTPNELYKYLAKSMIRNGILKGENEVAQSSNGDMFIRVNNQVFKLHLEEIQAISQHSEAEKVAKEFMQTQPYPYTEADA